MALTFHERRHDDPLDACGADLKERSRHRIGASDKLDVLLATGAMFSNIF